MSNVTPAPAFPQSVSSPDGPVASYDFVDGAGMTLRDYFAAKAMQGLVGKMAFDQPSEDMMMKAGIQPDQFEAFAASLAYSMADAMLKARGT